MKRILTIEVLLFLFVLSGCATTQYDFGKICTYNPDSQPSFFCHANEPGKEWV